MLSKLSNMFNKYIDYIVVILLLLAFIADPISAMLTNCLLIIIIIKLYDLEYTMREGSQNGKEVRDNRDKGDK